MDRVKFYSPTDLSIGQYLDRIEKIITTIEKIRFDELIDVLEAFNVLKFLHYKIYPVNLSDEHIAKVKGILNKKINLYFVRVTKEELLNYFRYFFRLEILKLKIKL